MASFSKEFRYLLGNSVGNDLKISNIIRSTVQRNLNTKMKITHDLISHVVRLDTCTILDRAVVPQKQFDQVNHK